MNTSLIELNKDSLLLFLHCYLNGSPHQAKLMNDTLLIWFNPDHNSYEIGASYDYQSSTSVSQNEDRFEILYEFEDETKEVAHKILSKLNLARVSSAILNY